MRVRTNRLVLADTGFWIAYYEERDEHHTQAVYMFNKLALGTFLFPWPLYYELLRTRFVKHPVWMKSFRQVIAEQRIKPIDDQTYRESALEQTFYSARNQGRSISLADWVIRMVLDDPRQRVAELITFNARDFVDVCKRRGIPMRVAEQ